MRIILIPLFLLLFATGFSTGQPGEGKTLYEHHCSRCHGTDGARGLFGAKNLQKSLLPDTAIALQIRNGKRIMPSFKKKFTPDQINEVSAYIKTLRIPAI
ncbi:cytochrome c [Chitinophaga sp. S165]|uniref:c-type cytochrome n=1 Tax=Chitinophaga sp. S165 TaxID=2135462 RepID=UPI000D845999|nr:cytochrome c [Chitinophaga sp. S165]PWV56806.1 cbb3-type cytochrome c oxidase subunit III [Chitinophaga sp. S165]